MLEGNCNKNKKGLERFISRSILWAKHFEEFKESDIEKITHYLNSDDYYNAVINLKSKCNTQKEFNIEMTDMIAELFVGMLEEKDHGQVVNRILKINEINPME